jgi:hypothetical protein
MPQHQDLGFQLLSRLEVVAQHADEQEADCHHAATSDGVFGNDVVLGG